MRPLAIRASALLNADSVAQAEAVINRLKVIDNKSPLSLYFQGMVAQNKKDVTTAADFFTRGAAAMPAAAGADSNLKAALELGAAQMTRLSAQSMTGDQKKTGMLKAADLYRKFLADFPKSPNAPDAQAGLAASLSASGDAQSVSKLWDDMLATPANYTSAQLYDAGTQAFTANQFGPAVKLMDAAQAKNGWLRPGLYNAANVYWKAGDFDRMLAASKKLTQIDPNNPGRVPAAGARVSGEIEGDEGSQGRAGLQRFAQRRVRCEREGEGEGHVRRVRHGIGEAGAVGDARELSAMHRRRERSRSAS